MTYHFDSKSLTYRQILDDQNQIVGAVAKKPPGGYDLYDGEKHLIRALPFATFQSALDYFIEIMAKKNPGA